MSIRVEDCLRKITLPKQYFNDKFDIAEKFREEAAEYLKLLKLIDGSEFEPDKADMIRNGIEDVTDEIQKNVNSTASLHAGEYAGHAGFSQDSSAEQEKHYLECR